MEENIVKGEQFERKIKLNMGQLTFDVLKSLKENIVQIDAGTGEILLASALLKRAVRLSKFLTANGIQRGDSVAIMSENRLEFCLVPIASFFIGAIFTPLNPDYTVGEIHHVIGFSKPKLIFASPTVMPRLLKVQKSSSCLNLIVMFDSDENSDSSLSFNNIIKNAENDKMDSNFKVDSFDPIETVATILCSSGTTGVPKGVMTTHDNMTACIEILSKVPDKIGKDENDPLTDTALGIAPFFHSFGFLTMYIHILWGKTMIVFNKFKPKVFLDVIVEYKIRTLMIPPPLLVFLVKNPLVEQYDLSCVKEVFIGAAPLPKETEMELRRRFKFRHAGQSYGMTETTWGVISSPHTKAKLGSVGMVFPGIMAKVIDDDGRALGPNERGELCVKGPMIMKGYAGNEKATKHCIDEENWLHTGDIAYYDNDRYFFIVDRIKELIKYKGFQVSPSELEELLLSHPLVSDAAVVGLPDEYYGELPLAFIVKTPEAELSSESLQEFVKEKVSPQKQLRGGVIFIEEIPRNVTGKILRRMLKEEAIKRQVKHKY